MASPSASSSPEPPCSALLRGPDCYPSASLRFRYDAAAPTTYVSASGWIVRWSNSPVGAYGDAGLVATLVTPFPSVGLGLGPLLVTGADGRPGIAFNTYAPSALAAPHLSGDARTACPAVASGGVFLVLVVSITSLDTPSVLVSFEDADTGNSTVAQLAVGGGFATWAAADVSYPIFGISEGVRTVIVVQHGSDGVVRALVDGVVVRTRMHRHVLHMWRRAAARGCAIALCPRMPLG